MRALVTGASGFLGSHLCERLVASEADVLGIARSTEAHIYPTEKLDLCNLDDLTKVVEGFQPTHVFHCAGALRSNDSKGLILANIHLTQQLIEVLSRAAMQPVVILPSSSAIYGPPENLPISEEHRCSPTDLYGITKRTQEMLFDQQRLVTDIPWRILRIFNMVGPRQPASLLAGSVAEQIAKVESAGSGEVVVGDLSAKRDLVDVRDVAQACIDAAQTNSPSGEIYNVCSGRSVSMQYCVDWLISQSTAKIGLTTKPSRPGLLNDHYGTSARLAEATGWSPRYSLEDSLADLLSSARDAGAAHT